MKSLNPLAHGLPFLVPQSSKGLGLPARLSPLPLPRVAAITSIVLLACCLGVAAAKGKPGAGNQPIPGTAEFTAGWDITSNGQLVGGWVDHGTFETISGELAGGETLTISGEPGLFLAVLDDCMGGVLPEAADCDLVAGTVTFFDAGWHLRLDKDKEPPNRVQLRITWTNANGEFHAFSMGLPPFSELFPDDFGEVTAHADGTYLADGEQPSLTDATVAYMGDPFQLRAHLLTGKGKKTALFVYSSYYELDEFGNYVLDEFDNPIPEDGTASCVILTEAP